MSPRPNHSELPHDERLEMPSQMLRKLPTRHTNVGAIAFMPSNDERCRARSFALILTLGFWGPPTKTIPLAFHSCLHDALRSCDRHQAPGRLPSPGGSCVGHATETRQRRKCERPIRDR